MERARAIERIAWLAGVAELLEVPRLATVEAPEHHGPIVAAVASRLDGVPVFDKACFGLAAAPEIAAAVAATGRRTAVLVGFETDVCVAQSALGLIDAGFRVAVVADATASPQDGHQHGLTRVAGVGAVVTSTKGLYYEWLRTVERAVALRTQIEPLGLPRDFSL